MIRARSSLWVSLVVTASFAAACGGEDPPPPPPTQLAITVLDAATGAPIDGAVLAVLKRPGAALSASVAILAPGSATRWRSNAQGVISGELAAGVYALRIDAAAYLSVPEPFAAPLTVAVAAGQTTELTVSLEPLAGSFGSGVISGRITRAGVPQAGVLVHAESTSAYSTVSDVDGTYVLLGLTDNLYRVEALWAGHSAAVKPSVDVAAAEVINVDFDMAAATGAVVTATIGPGAGTTSVAIALATTGEPIPGAVAVASFGAEARITGVPAGDFAVVAGLERDGRVVSPDLLRRRMPAAVSIQGEGDVRVPLPTAAAVGGLTVDTSTAGAPTIAWDPFPGATFYVVEVDDLRGRALWGGLDARGQTLFRVRAPATSVRFGDLATPVESLQSGRAYRARVYAGREVPATGTYELMAGSEPLEGRFRAR